MNDKATAPGESQSVKFGTFGGVFTPSLLTILGVIMYLRFSTVVGYAGLWHAFIILAGATVITTITALSISSIATNMRVKGGGAYYLISRSLGVEFGSVIAIFFYIAQTVAVTLYIVGFTEALFSAFPGIGLSFRAVATITNLIVFACVYIGAGWTIRLQYGILVVLLLSILSFFAGAITGFSTEILQANMVPNWMPGYSFFPVFALFFPAVTGIMAGVNMSGDLRDPSRSIPRGTLASIGFSTVIYAAIAFLLAASVPRAELLGDGFVMKDHAFLPALIFAGVICATLSSALGSMMGAPRILQAFARDNVFRNLRWFGSGRGHSGEPTRATVLTFLIAQVGIIAGDLDTIAPVITMFFLLTYGTVNLACFYESRSSNPSFRPTFRMNHWSIALIGALGCLGVMFLINAVWALVAIALAGVLYFFIARAEIQVKWGDVDSGLAYQRARKGLLSLEKERYHPKNWRPSILVLAGGAKSRLHLYEYASWFTMDSGIVSIGQVIRGELEHLLDRRQEAEAILRKSILKEGIAAFPVVIVEENIHAAIKALLQCHGIGGMRPNTVMLGWSEDAGNLEVFSETLNITKKMKRSLIIVACEEEEVSSYLPGSTINVWWTSPKNGALMLLLAYLLTRNSEWRDHTLRIIRPVALKANVQGIEGEMQEMLSQARIKAELAVLPTETPLEEVRRLLKPSDLLFAGFEPPDEEPTCCTIVSQLQPIVDLPVDVILVYNAGDVSLIA